MATATLKTLLLGEDRSASKTLNKVGDSADHAKHRLSGFGSFLGTMAKGGAIALGGLGAGAFAMGVKTAAANEVAQNSFTTLLGSATKAKAFLTDLQGFAAATPFDLPGVETAAQQLLNVGLQSKQVIPFLTAFGDASSAAGQSTEQFNSTMTQTVQALSKGKFSIGDLNQISSNGIPVTKLLGEAWHKSTGEIQAMAQHGDLTAQKVLPALQKQMEKDYGGGMARQSQTLIGLWSTLQDTLSQAMAKVLLPLMPVLKDGVAGATNLVAAAVPKVTAAFHALSPVLNKVGDFVKKNAAFLKPFGIALGVVAGAIGLVTLATTAFSIALNSTGIPLVVVGIAALVAGLVLLYKHSSKFRDIIATVGQIITTQVWPIMQKFGQFVIGTLVPAVVQIAQKVGSSLRPIFEQLATTFKTRVLPAISQILTKFKQWQPTIERVIGVVVKLIGKVLEFAAKVLAKVLPVVIRFAGWLISKLVPAILGTITVVARIIGALIKFGAALVDGAQKVATFAGKVAGQVARVVTFFVQLPAKIIAAIGDLSNTLYQKGKDLIGGLIRGIKSVGSSAIGGTIHALSGGLLGRLAATGRRTGLSLGNQILVGLVPAIQNGWVKAKVAYDKITAYISAQNDKIKGLLSEKAGIISSLQGFGSSIFGASFTDAEGNDVAPTASSLIGYQQQQLAQAQQLRGDISKLLKMGLSKSLIMQMVNAGPSGMADIHALAQGTASDIATLNSASAQTNAALTAAGQSVGGALYNAQIASATKDRDAATAVEKGIERALRKNDKNTVVELHIGGKSLQVSLLELKRHNGNRPLGLA